MKIFAITLGFMPVRILERSLRAYAATRHGSLEYRHVLLDQHYPVDKEQNRSAVRALCDELGIEVMDAGRNLGLHVGFNYVLDQLNPAADDIIIAYDGDSTPVGNGWDLALVRTLLGDPQKKVVWASLTNPRSAKDLGERGYIDKVIDGHLHVRVTKTAVTNSVCAWNFGWLKSVGLLTEPSAFYGHLETAMFEKLGANQWAFVRDYIESDELRDLHDRSYVVYKWCHAHLKSWPGDFESWLAAGSPNPEAKTTPSRLP